MAKLARIIIPFYKQTNYSAGFLLFTPADYIQVGQNDLPQSHLPYTAIIIFLAIAAFTIVFTIWRSSSRGRAFWEKFVKPSAKDISVKPPEGASRSSSMFDNINLESGIGTGVVKIFQQIKDNMGSLETLRTGYRHLLDLSCEQLNFDGGAIFIIDKDGVMRLCGYAGLKPDSQLSYSIFGEGLVAETFQSDFPRFETDLSKIAGEYHGLFNEYKSAWLLPLMPQGKPIGIIMFFHKDIPDNRENYFPRLDFVSIAASWFYENHNNQILIKKESKRTGILVKTSLAISMSLDLNKVCHILVAQLGKAYGCSYSYILLNEGDDKSVYVQQYFSERGEPIFQPNERLINIQNMSWLQDLIYLGNPTLLDSDEIRLIPRGDTEILKIDNSSNTLIAPLKYAGKFEGILIMVEQRSGDRASMDEDVVNLTAALVAQASAAIENARMYALISDKVAHLSAMFDVSQALNSDLDLIPFLEKVLRTISKNFGITNCTFLMRDYGSGELYIAGLVGNYPMDAISRRFKPGEGITGEAARIGKPINVGDVSIDNRFIRSTGNTGSELAVPVVLNGETVGVLDVESHEKYAFSHREEELLKSIVDQVAAAIEKLRLKQQEREHTSKLAITNGLVKKLSGIIDKSELLKQAVLGIKEGFGFDLAAIFIIDDEHKITLAQQSCNSGYGYEPGLHIDKTMGLIGEVITNMKSKYADQLAVGEPSAGFSEVKSRYCIPLAAGDNMHGALEIQDRKALAISAVDQSMLQTIAEFLSLTLNNVLLYSDTIEKAERLGLARHIHQIISTTLDIEELFMKVLQSLSDATGFNWATMIFMADSNYQTSFEYYKSEYRRDNWRPSQLNCLDKYFKEALAHNRPAYYILNEMDMDERLRQYLTDQGIAHLGISPIRNDEKQASILLIGSHKPEGFKQKDQYIIADISEHLQVALKNVTLYSELKNAYNSLAEARDKLIQSEKFKMLGEVAAGVAHDFKNIMAAIMGRAQMLSLAAEQPEGIPRELLMKSMNVIEKSAMDGVNILSRINQFTKNKTAIDFKHINICEIIRDVIEMTRPKWSDPNDDRVIDVKFSECEDVIISGDRSMMVEVFSNLINNSVDAIEGTGVIDIDIKCGNNDIEITFTDNGCGMDQQTLKKIFDPFFTTKSHLGTGLGLSMVYSIIDNHNGQINVESEPGKGSKFIIKLPRVVSKKTDAGPSVLVVDDDENLRNVLYELFTEMNIPVKLAENYKNAILSLEKEKFDIILTDLGLPDKDGWGIIDAVKASMPDSIVIPMTGWNKESDRQEIASRGLNTVLLKPFTIDQVNEIINAYKKRKSNVGSFA